MLKDITENPRATLHELQASVSMLDVQVYYRTIRKDKFGFQWMEWNAGRPLHSKNNIAA